MNVPNISGLGTGTVTESGGTVSLQANPTAIAVHWQGGPNNNTAPAVSLPAGINQQSNWNNITNKGNGATPGYTTTNLLNSLGVPTSVSVTDNNTGNWWWTNNTPTSGNGQLLDGYLDDNAAAPKTSSIDFSNVPIGTYTVILYTATGPGGCLDDYTISGGTNVNLPSTTQYFLTSIAPNAAPTLVKAAPGGNATTAAEANYVEWDNVVVTGTTGTITISGYDDVKNAAGYYRVSYAGAQLIPASTAYSNNFVINGTATLDVTNVAAATIGSLTIANSTLNVTGGSTGANTAYSLTANGTVTLTGNATINVANNGTGTGTLSLGSLTDNHANTSLTTQGNGTVTLTSGANMTATGDAVNAQRDAEPERPQCSGQPDQCHQ